MSGIVGRLLHEFAVTISVAILVSGFVSLTLTPMLCSRFLKSRHRSEAWTVYTGSRRVFSTGWPAAYDCTLKSVLRHRLATMCVSVLVLVAHRLSVHVYPQRLYPQPGYRADLRHHRSRPGHLVRLHGRSISRPSTEIIYEGPQCRIDDVFRRRAVRRRGQ